MYNTHGKYMIKNANKKLVNKVEIKASSIEQC